MPRYRFDWANISDDLASALAATDEPDNDPRSSLRSRFGARPKEEFVKQHWHELREVWLGNDRSARHRVIDELQEAGLGATISRRNRSAEMEYLRSVRNAKKLRNIVLAAFHEHGETPSSPTTASESAAPASPAMTTGRPTTAASTSPTPARPTSVRIGRPTRKYVGIGSISESPEGEEFIGTLVAFTGEPEITSLAKIRDVHVFVARGENGVALVMETQGVKCDPNSWCSVAAFSTWSEPRIDATLEMARWDPWREFDGEVVRGATASQRQVWDRRRTELAADTDTFGVSAVDAGAELLGLSSTELEACWNKVFDNAPPPKVELSQSSEEPSANGSEETPVVAARVLAILRGLSDDETLDWDDDGDAALRFGSSMVFVRVFGDPPVVRVFAPALAQVPAGRKIVDVVNELNRTTSFTKWLSVDDTIYASIDLFGSPLTEEHVVHACRFVGSIADQFDDQLQAQLGGKTFFGEYTPPPLPRSTPGYL